MLGFAQPPQNRHKKKKQPGAALSKALILR
jgi:hypothetical protein